jgi:hypothetical protein
VQLDLFQRLKPQAPSATVPGGGKWVASETIVVGGTSIEVHFIRHPRARVFRLTLCRDGSGRVTLPRYGFMPGARNFLLQHVQWLAERAHIQRANSAPTDPSKGAVQIRFRGQFETVSAPEDLRDSPVASLRFVDAAAIVALIRYVGTVEDGQIAIR